MDNLRSVWFKIDFIFNFDGVYVREKWILVFLMSCERESVHTRFMRSVECKRHIFNIKGFNLLFKKRVPRILYLMFATAKRITSVRVLP